MGKLETLAAFAVGVMLWFCAAVRAEVPLGGRVGDDVVSLIYNPANGNLSLDSAGKTLTTLQVTSASGVFTGRKPAQLNGDFDVYVPGKLFMMDPEGFGDEEFGFTVLPGLDAGLARDLSIDGSVHGGGNLGAPDLIIVPEPAAVALVGLGLLSLVGVARRPR